MRNPSFFDIVFEAPFNYAAAKAYIYSIQWTVFSISIAYIFVIFGIQYYMRNRTAFEIRLPLRLWNLGLAVFSIVGSYITTKSLFNEISTKGLSSSYCYVGNFFQGTSGLWTFIFSMSKIAELGDTIFIVLRKRPLMFLHWFHHVATLNYGMLTYADGTAFNSWIIWLNFTVHAFMYSYYFLAACKIRVPAVIAQSITFLQLLQFVITHAVLFHVWYLVAEGTPCHMHTLTFTYCLLMEMSYVYLFGRFFYQNYIQGGGKKYQRELAAKKTDTVKSE